MRASAGMGASTLGVTVHTHLQSGALSRVLPDWSLPSADVFAVYGERMTLSAKVTAFVDFLADWFGREPRS
jgi:DNA-binding transcriptional LysR family regulator